MQNVSPIQQESNIAAAQTNVEQKHLNGYLSSKKGVLTKIRGGLFLVLGYLLSPLCWWNDLIFNLPIAYLFGYICSLFSPKLLLPCSILGYWVSNLAGIVLMQLGAIDVFQSQPTKRDLKKELLTGLVTSTIYTLVILALIQLKILDTPTLF